VTTAGTQADETKQRNVSRRYLMMDEKNRIGDRSIVEYTPGSEETS
jgi:hypothetical protein